MLTRNKEDNSTKLNKYKKAPKKLTKAEMKGKHSIIDTELGKVKINLFSEDAPLAVTNHIFLSKEGFYDGLTFHRREEGFVLQGGDPMGLGYGGPGYKFADELKLTTYSRGIVAMANSGPNTNGSQFFIMLANCPLPPLYTIFGEVIEGMEVIDKLKIDSKIIKITIV